MKLMIVDDEELTRKGLIASMNWDKLGITEIYEADDGMNGVELAKKVAPDIIICDVRMPRMDGIRMLEKIQKINPDASAIFMSGFSDKEYLKAAIRLGAVNYIEKPIETRELKEAVIKAIEQNSASVIRHDAREEMKYKASEQLINALTLPYESNKKNIEKYAADFCRYFDVEGLAYATPVIVRAKERIDSPNLWRELVTELNAYIASMNLNAVYTEKHASYLVIFILGHRTPGAGTMELITGKIAELVGTFSEYQIVVGETVCGLPKVYDAYQSAVIRLQNAFFCKINCVLRTNDGARRDVSETMKNVRAALAACKEQIAENDYEAVQNCLQMIYGGYKESSVLPNQAKSTYYEILLTVYDEAMQRHLEGASRFFDRENIMEIMDGCFCLDEMHEQAERWIGEYFDILGNGSEENATVRLIRDYIADYFADPNLSVKTISEYANMSTSYVCTFFKNETGSTINQYITDFRMKKAKQLLSDPRNRISEISAMVGYSDSNYFGKNFKKLTGYTPSEYREQVIG